MVKRGPVKQPSANAGPRAMADPPTRQNEEVLLSAVQPKVRTSSSCKLAGMTCSGTSWFLRGQ
jgi:hypothetical protein